MRLTIIAVNTRQPAWAQSAVDEFLGRLPSDWALTLKTVKAEPRDGRPTPQVASREAEKIRGAIPAGALLIALDEAGETWTTTQFSNKLQTWRDAAQHPVFVIGGTDGLDDGFKREARHLLRLSSFTLPHALARVLLAEQLYRCWSILANHPYHRS